MKKWLVIGGGVAAVLVLAMAAAGVWYTQFRADAPAEVSLESALAGPLGATPVAGATTELAGIWTIAPSGSSFAGYRVKEELARIGATTAVGRTSAVTGTLRFDGTAITEVQITADLSALKSDSGMRDNALRSQAIETAKYPTATFTLTQPIALAETPAEGTKVAAIAVGDLTLHGVTRSISIPLEGQRSGGQVVVVGATEITFADFGIAQPRGAAVLAIEDHGTLELQLVFEKAGSQS